MNKIDNNIIDNNMHKNTIKNINDENLFNQGDIVKGTIKELNDGLYTINIQNKRDIKANESTIQGNIGDEILLEATNTNTLKQIKTHTRKDIKNIPSDILIEDNKYTNFINNNVDNININDSKNINVIKGKISHITNTFSPENMDSMQKIGLNPKDTDIFTFSDFLALDLNDNVHNKKEKPKTVDEHREDMKKRMKMDLNMNGADEEELFRYENTLKEAGLPITQKNINSLKNLDDKINNAKNLDKNAMLNLIKSGKEITAQDLYTAKHSKIEKTAQNTDALKIKDIDKQIQNILKEENIAPTDENMKLAKDFIQNDIELSYKNFYKMQKLEKIKANNDTYDILQKGAINISKNENIFDINILNNTLKDIKKYDEMFKNVDETHIQAIIQKDKKINIQNIIEQYNKNENLNDITPTDESIKHRLNLAKIQLKLTNETLYTLNKKGIDINTKPLENVIKELETIEKDNYKTIIEKTGATSSDKNINTMRDVFSSLNNTYKQNVYKTYSDIINKKVDFSLKGINDSLKMSNIMKDFDTFKTMPLKGFDSINKVSFDKQLDDTGFINNEKNTKILKILSLNELELNEENIIKAKLIDEKINYMYDKMHPITVGKMLKDGFNPLHKNIDDIIAYIDKFSEDNGQTSRETLASNILNIDKDNKLTQDKKDAILSVYKVLHKIEKNDSLAIGNILKSEKNITFNNLLEASKIGENIKKNKRFDKKIDENTGENITVKKDNSITKINNALDNEMLQYNKFIINDIIAKLDDKNALYLYENSTENIEDIAKDIQKNIATNNYDTNIQNMDISDNTIITLIKNNIPITLNNISFMEKILKDKISPSKNIEDMDTELLNRAMPNIKSIEKSSNTQKIDESIIQNNIENIEQEADEIFDNIMDIDDLDDMKNMILKNQNMVSSIKFIKSNNNAKNGLYKLPIRLNDGHISELNVLILNDKKLTEKDANIYVDFTNKNNKKISTYISVKDNGAFANVCVDTEKMLSEVKENIQDVLNILEKFNVTPENIVYNISEQKDIYNDDFMDNINENVPYSTDKINTII